MIPRFQIRYGWREAWLALRSVGNSLPQEDRLWASLGLDSGRPRIFPTRRGREALYLILKGLALPRGARVGVPLYVCSTVAKTVLAAGMTPVFLDADPRTFGLNLDDLKRKAEKLDCLVLVHMFGYPVDFDSVQQLMQGKPVVEDCAHAVGSSFRGHPLGTLAATSFFSFGFFKPLAVGGGGCVITQSEGVAVRIEELLLGAPEETPCQTILHSTRCFLYALAYHQPAYSILAFLRARGQGDTSTGIEDDTAGEVIAPRLLRMRQSDRGVLASRLPSFDVASERNEEFWAQLRSVSQFGLKIPPEPAFGQWNHFMLPVRERTEANCLRAIAQLRSRGIGAARLYPDCAQYARAARYSGDCPIAERLARTVFMLPCYAGLSKGARDRILRAIQQLKTS